MDELERLAAASVGSGNRSALQGFRMALSDATDLEGLRRLADAFTPHSEVSIPVYERLLALRPGDVKAMVALGFVHFLDGDDEQAKEWLEKAKSQAPSAPDVLLLQAALVREPDEKERLYRQVLAVDPKNAVALAQLSKAAPGLKRE